MPSEYKRHADNEPYRQGCKLYMEPDTVLAVCAERGLTARLIRFHRSDAFVVVDVVCTRSAYKAAQYEWLQRMIANPPKPVEPLTTEIDLFA